MQVELARAARLCGAVEALTPLLKHPL